MHEIEKERIGNREKPTKVVRNRKKQEERETDSKKVRNRERKNKYA